MVGFVSEAETHRGGAVTSFSGINLSQDRVPDLFGDAGSNQRQECRIECRPLCRNSSAGAAARKGKANGGRQHESAVLR